MKLRQKLSSAFAAASLAFGAVPALAQDAPAPAPVAAPVTETAAPAAPTTEMPDISTFDSSTYILLDSRGPAYKCPDNTNSCWTDAERDAGAVREFQQMMMATTFACRQRPGMSDLTDRYDNFITRYQGYLVQSYNLVGARFKALSPDARTAARAQDNLDTIAANMYSGGATKDGFCEVAGQVLRHLSAEGDNAELLSVAKRMIARPAAPTPPPAAPGA